ncbi:MAG: sugar kinase [Cardiobacteriaceae bacterium]|nr:sugar kinase [Cardiobacteriaceae bacterium]
MLSIALIGECMIELNGAPFGAMQQTYGGDSLNTATYLARAMAPLARTQVHYITALGDDPLSRGMIARWQADGIQTDYVLRDPVRQPGLYLIQVDARGERTFLYWRNQSAARYMLQHPDWPRIEASLPQFDAIYVSGISLAILPPEDRARLIALLARCVQQGGAMLVFDGNYRPKLWQSADETRACYQALLPHVDLALMTFDDEQALWGDVSPEASIARLQAAGVNECVIKLGAEGALYARGEAREAVPTVPVANVVDTTSAGDAFNAGFLAGYAEGKDARECCAMGNRLAGIVIQHKGAIIPKEYCCP